jgi:hypothetical protein
MYRVGRILKAHQYWIERCRKSFTPPEYRHPPKNLTLSSQFAVSFYPKGTNTNERIEG